MMIIKRTFKWGVILAITWLCGFFLTNWITGYFPNPTVAAGFSFTLAFILGIITKKLGVLG